MISVGVIGGGPVGTLCACLLKEQCPDVKVAIFEQRPAFTRDQILLITDLTVLPEKVVQVLIPQGCYVERPAFDTTGKCYKTPSDGLLFSIKISLLEEALWQYAKSIGVLVHRPKTGKDAMEINDPRLKEFDVLIGAGGKNDIVRNHLGFQVREQPVSYAVVMTWNRPDMKKSIQVKRRSRRSRSRRRRHHRRSSQDRYRMFRTPSTNYYASIQLIPAEAKRLMKQDTLSWKSLDAETRKSFDSVMKYYNVKDHEFDPREAKLTMFPITLYQSNGYVDVDKIGGRAPKLMVAIGDAVNGVHFFSGTGVSTGFKMATLVADLLCDFFHDEISVDELMAVIDDHFDKYIKEAQKSSRQVILNAKAVGECNRESMKELRRLAKAKNYQAINNLPKHELCLIMAKEF